MGPSRVEPAALRVLEERQVLRVGALDGLSLSGETQVVLTSTGFSFFAGEGTVQIPIQRKWLLQLRGGGQVSGYFFGDVAMRIGLGDAPRSHLFLVPTLGFVALRGTAGNLAASVGTAVMGTLMVAVLSAGVISSLTANPVITPDLKQQVDLDSINFLSNVRLEERLKSTTATPEQVTEAIRINEEARLRALKIAFFAMGCLALLAIFPSRKLPDYRPGEVPDENLKKA